MQRIRRVRLIEPTICVVIQRGYRLLPVPMIAMMLLGMLGFASLGTVAAQGTGPAPTVGEIVVDSYNCASGELKFHVPVTNLPSAPVGNNTYQFPLLYTVDANYEDGSFASANTSSPFLPLAFNPAATDAPYTGDVDLSSTVSTTNRSGSQPVASAITSIDLYVAVGYGGDGADAFNDPIGTSTTTYTVDCSDEGTPDGGFIARLVAVLVRVLSQIFNR